MNEARTAAGLAEFKPASEETQVLPQHSGTVMKISAETLWNEICKKIMVRDALHLFCFSFLHAKQEVDITQADDLVGTFAYYAGKNDCKAAVQYWKDGLSLFNDQLPPTYKALNDPAVYTDKAVSFVALYNPKANPVASCAFVTCTKGSVVAAPDQSENHEGREEEWRKIVQAIVGTEKGNGISPVGPSLVVGFIMMLFAYELF
ncbi:SAG family member [Eimeria necatrix]|uniref:SAG family member n=1 Tax=Eimeria necatrix TaxID=51315 RepID=U6MJB2_9EIME|nr:SAG family member [Eimeria necatrix]CDJ63163.1 SAG family member [Eimeria necatrix]